MRPSTISQTGVGYSNPFPLDYVAPTFQVALHATVDGGVVYSIEHTLDNILAGEPASWSEHDAMKDLSVVSDGNYFFPVTAIRINVKSGTGTVNLRIVQRSGY